MARGQTFPTLVSGSLAAAVTRAMQTMQGAASARRERTRTGWVVGAVGSARWGQAEQRVCAREISDLTRVFRFPFPPASFLLK